MPIEIKNMRGPSLCPKCGAAPKIEKHPPSFGDDGSVVFSCCAITSVADDITGAQAHWDGAVVGYRAGVEDAARAIEAEVARIAELAAERDELAAVIDSAEIRNGLTDNGSMWRFWVKKAREALDMQAVARAEGYRAGVEAAAEICAKHAGLPTGNDYENGWLSCACIVELEIRALLDSEAKP
jgi:hypothetical protein